MSADKREDILARLYAIIKTISGITTYARMLGEMPEASRPYIVLIDGNEVRADDSRGKGRQTVIMVMTPTICAGASATSDDVGADVNAIRAKILPAILTDTT